MTPAVSTRAASAHLLQGSSAYGSTDNLDLSSSATERHVQAPSTPANNLLGRAVKVLGTLGILAGGMAAGAAGAGLYNSRSSSPANPILSQMQWPQIGNSNPELPASFVKQSQLVQQQGDALRTGVTTAMQTLGEMDDALFGRRSNYFSNLDGFYDVRSLFEFLRDATNSAGFFKLLPPFIRDFYKDENIGATIAPQLASDFYHDDGVSLQELTKDNEYRSAQFFYPADASGPQNLSISGISEALPLVLKNSSNVLEALCWHSKGVLEKLTGAQVAEAIDQFAAMIDGASTNDTYITPAHIEFSFGYRISALLNGLVDSYRRYGTVYPERNKAAFHNNTAELARALTTQQKTHTQLQTLMADFKTLSQGLNDAQQQQTHIAIAGASVAGAVLLLAVLSKYAPALYRQVYTALGLAPRQANAGLRERLMSADAQKATEMLNFATHLSAMATENPTLRGHLEGIAQTMAEQTQTTAAGTSDIENPVSTATITEIEEEGFQLNMVGLQDQKFIRPEHSAIIS